jgi:signal transduction histidine kinase
MSTGQIDKVSELQQRLPLALEIVLGSSDPIAVEMALATCFDIGRTMVSDEAGPDQVVTLYHDALQQIAAARPNLISATLASRLYLPLLELSMAHGMAFREQMESRYQQMLKDRMVQASRLEAIGTLAAGIGHDFNNIIGSIAGFAEMSQELAADDSFIAANMAQIIVACTRASDLVQRMLAFARDQNEVLTIHSLDEEIRGALDLLRPSLGSMVEVLFTNKLPAGHPAHIMAGGSHIQQIIMNLVLNACDAMAAKGRITITLQRTEPPPIQRADKRQWVAVIIADNGCGMPPEVMGRIFDPFYTTKAPKGSGLGLSVVHGIVQQLGGDISVLSRTSGEQRGTEFTLLLPLNPVEIAT